MCASPIQSQGTNQIIKFETDIPVKSGLFGTKQVHVLTIQNAQGTKFEIQIDAKKYNTEKFNAIREEFLNQIKDTKLDATQLKTIIKNVVKEQGVDPKAIKVKKISQSFFQKIGFQKDKPLLAPAESREIKPLQDFIKQIKALNVEIGEARADHIREKRAYEAHISLGESSDYNTDSIKGSDELNEMLTEIGKKEAERNKLVDKADTLFSELEKTASTEKLKALKLLKDDLSGKSIQF